MPADVKSAFDIAFWLSDTALNCNEYLQPQKLQRLLFLSQGYYTVVFPKRKLMPAVFVADEIGPIEPNVFLSFTRGRPNIDVDLFLPHEVESFMDSIWRRFGHFSAEKLGKMTKESEAYKRAKQRGPRAEITMQEMRLSFARAESTPSAKQVVRPKMLRTQAGKPVTVQAWTPGKKISG